MAQRRQSQFDALLADAHRDPDVLGVFLFGSRTREGFSDPRSDYDVGVVVADRDGALAAFDRRWPYVHGAEVEVASSTLSQLREHGEYGTPSEWARYQYAHARVLVDKTGEVEPIVRVKERVPEEVRADVIREALDSYINSTHRSLRNRTIGVEQGARLDAAESLPYVLTVVFAMEARVRPFNKYLAWELRSRPLAEAVWAADMLLPRLEGVLAGDADEQHALFRDVDRLAREHGFDDVVDGWQPDVAWLRGEAGYRA